MAKKSSSRFKDREYTQIIARSKPQAEQHLQELGLLLPERLYGDSYSRKLIVKSSFAQGRSELLSELPAHIKEKDRIIAYYAREDVQREIYKYAKGRHISVLRNFKPMFSELMKPEDVLPLMFHYLKGNRWASMHGTIFRHTESGHNICDFIFEPDFKKDWTIAFDSARPIIRLFLKLGLPFVVKFSGHSSPHIIVPGEALASAGDRELRRQDFRDLVYNYVRSHMGKPGLLDGPNWHPDHYLRLPYSIHELAGKVSVPILPDEFDSFNPDKARIENVTVIEDWWDIPQDASERGKEFVRIVTKSYPKLVSAMDKVETEHKWKPPPVPRKLRQLFDDRRYDKMLKAGRQLLTAVGEKPIEKSMSDALAMLSRWEDADLKVDIKSAAEVFGLDAGSLRQEWDSHKIGKEKIQTYSAVTSIYHYDYYSRAEIQEMIYSYAEGHCFWSEKAKAYFRLKEPSDVPLFSAYFEASEAEWNGFECTKATYNPVDNQISASDIIMEIDFSRSDIESAVELAQILTSILKRYEVFCFVKFDGNERLEIVIPSDYLPEVLDGRKTVLQIHKIASGLNRGLRRMPEVSGNDCILIIQPYGLTRPAYSLNPHTGLSCIVVMPDDLQNFSLENAEPTRVSVNRKWLDIPPDTKLQAQRFLKYVLSPNWRPAMS